MPRPKIDDISGTANTIGFKATGKPAVKKPAKAQRLPSAAEVREALAALKAFREAGAVASEWLKRMEAETWPICDEDNPDGHLSDQVNNMIDTEYEPVEGVVVDMSIDTMLGDVEALIADMDPASPEQAPWAKKALDDSKSARAAGAPDNIAKVFYRRLRQIIKYRRISRSEFARQLAESVDRHPEVKGMSKAQVNRWFDKCKRSPRGPSMIFLGLLAEYLGTTVGALLDLSIPVYALPPREAAGGPRTGRPHRRPKVV